VINKTQFLSSRCPQPSGEARKTTNGYNTGRGMCGGRASWPRVGVEMIQGWLPGMQGVLRKILKDIISRVGWT
jgi:hypothetical protein